MCAQGRPLEKCKQYWNANGMQVGIMTTMMTQQIVLYGRCTRYEERIFLHTAMATSTQPHVVRTILKSLLCVATLRGHLTESSGIC